MAKSNKEVFEQSMRIFIKSTATSMRTALKLSQMGLEHFAECGDTIWLQRFHDAMPKNFHRRVAFVKWAQTFAPISFEENKFSKDKSEDANELDLVGAMKTTFWDFTSETPLAFWKDADLIQALEREIKKREGKKQVAADAAAVSALKDLRAYVERAKTRLGADTSDMLPSTEMVEEAAADAVVETEEAIAA